MPPMWVGFWAQHSLNKGPFFSTFSLDMGGLSRNWRKIVKNGWFSVKIHHKGGYDGKFWQREEGTFLRTGRQTPVHLHVMYPPWGLSTMSALFEAMLKFCTINYLLKVTYNWLKL